MYAYAHTHTLVVNAVVPTVLMSSKGDVCVYIVVSYTLVLMGLIVPWHA